MPPLSPDTAEENQRENDEEHDAERAKKQLNAWAAKTICCQTREHCPGRVAGAGDRVLEFALAELMEQVEIQRAVRRARCEYRARRDILAQSLRRTFGDSLTFEVPAAESRCGSNLMMRSISMTGRMRRNGAARSLPPRALLHRTVDRVLSPDSDLLLSIEPRSSRACDGWRSPDGDCYERPVPISAAAMSS